MPRPASLLASALFALGLGATAAAASEPGLVDAPFPPARPADLAALAAPVLVSAPLPPQRPAELGAPVRTAAVAPR